MAMQAIVGLARRPKIEESIRNILHRQFCPEFEVYMITNIQANIPVEAADQGWVSAKILATP